MNKVTRKDWGARDRKGSPTPLLRSQAKGIAVHYADAPSASDHKQCDDQVRGDQNFHMDTRGWSDIAYSWLVCRHGYIYEGRGWGVRTAAQGTDEGNAEYHAVCYLSADHVGELTSEGKDALATVVNTCAKEGWGSDVEPHRHFHPTSCPGHDVGVWVTNKGWTHPPAHDHKPAHKPEQPKHDPQPDHSNTPDWYTDVLSKGSTGRDVEWVQRRVGAHVDGDFGEETEQRVRGFQKAHHLTPDGIVGPQTAKAIGEHPTHGQVPAWYYRDLGIGDKGGDVVALRSILKLPISPLFDQRTEDALRQWESAHRLPTDGRVTFEDAVKLGDA